MAIDIHYKHKTGETDSNGNIVFSTTNSASRKKITVSKEGFETIEINFDE